MKTGRIMRRMLLCVTLALCALLLAACGKDADTLDLGEYFSQEEIDSWKKEDKDCKYTMNGGYYISFQGQLYPVEFEAGTIHWKTTPPDELFFVDTTQLYSDSALTKRCAYLGFYKEEKLFTTGIHHRGFLLDGSRPSYGSVLYFDEANPRTFTVRRGGLSCSVGPDDAEIVFYGYITGERKAELYYHEEMNLILSDEKGVFLEELNTVRKICEYARANGIPFDAYTEFTNLPYPSMLFWDNLHADGHVTYMDINTLELSEEYHISIHYQDEKYRDINCVVFVTSEAIQEFYRRIQWNLEKPDRFQNIVMDEQGLVTQYFDKYFRSSTAGKDNSAQVDYVFYSMAEFNAFVEQQTIIDPETKQSMYLSRTENGRPFNQITDYNTNIFPTAPLSLYAVWNEYHTVQLHGFQDTSEQVVCIDKDLVLPYAMSPGYEFEGWYTDENYSGQPITKISYADPYTDLYAKFRKVDSYTLTFAPYDGKTFEDISYGYGDTVSLPYLSKPFHVFKGWCIDPAGNTEPIKTVSKDFYGSFHLYPCFEPQKYTITLIVGDQTLQSSVCYGEHYFLLAHLAKEGFLGYFDESGVQYTDQNGKSLRPFTDGADIQLFAKYKEE